MNRVEKNYIQIFLFTFHKYNDIWLGAKVLEIARSSTLLLYTSSEVDILIFKYRDEYLR